MHSILPGHCTLIAGVSRGLATGEGTVLLPERGVQLPHNLTMDSQLERTREETPTTQKMILSRSPCPCPTLRTGTSQWGKGNRFTIMSVEGDL